MTAKTKKIEPQAEVQNEVEAHDPIIEHGPKQDVQLIGYKEEFLNKLLQYLGSKPYAEVAGLIHEIHQGQPVKV